MPESMMSIKVEHSDNSKEFRHEDDFQDTLRLTQHYSYGSVNSSGLKRVEPQHSLLFRLGNCGYRVRVVGRLPAPPTTILYHNDIARILKINVAQYHLY